MAVTIVVAKIKEVPLSNSVEEIIKVSGTISSSDTGTYSPIRKPILDAGGLPVVIGLPHGIQPAYSAGVITFTAGAGFTALNVYASILCEK